MIERGETAFGFDPRHLEYLGDLDPETLRLERRAPCAEDCKATDDNFKGNEEEYGRQTNI